MHFCKHKSYHLHECKDANNNKHYWVKCDICGKIFDLHNLDINGNSYTERPKTIQEVREELGLCSKE